MILFSFILIINLVKFVFKIIDKLIRFKVFLEYWIKYVGISDNCMSYLFY